MSCKFGCYFGENSANSYSRGKKVYRKFEEDDYDKSPMGSLTQDALGGLPAVHDPDTPRHFTRSSVKPRLLFPHASRPHGKTGDTTDEEAVTDIEYPPELQEAEPANKEVATPAKKRYYATPPTTAKATRTTAKHASPLSSPIKEEDGADSPFTVKRARTSPFDKWQRLKPSPSSVGRTRKRDAVSPVVDEGSKRQKS